MSEQVVAESLFLRLNVGSAEAMSNLLEESLTPQEYATLEAEPGAWDAVG
jgi:hypothetical protein